MRALRGAGMGAGGTGDRRRESARSGAVVRPAGRRARGPWSPCRPATVEIGSASGCAGRPARGSALGAADSPPLGGGISHTPAGPLDRRRPDAAAGAGRRCANGPSQGPICDRQYGRVAAATGRRRQAARPQTRTGRASGAAEEEGWRGINPPTSPLLRPLPERARFDYDGRCRHRQAANRPRQRASSSTVDDRAGVFLPSGPE